MTTLKSLMMVSALLVGGAGPFCATANELPDIGGWPPVAAAPDPAASIPARTARHHFVPSDGRSWRSFWKDLMSAPCYNSLSWRYLRERTS
jgi:hypothetical protein